MELWIKYVKYIELTYIKIYVVILCFYNISCLNVNQFSFYFNDRTFKTKRMNIKNQTESNSLI